MKHGTRGWKRGKGGGGEGKRMGRREDEKEGGKERGREYWLTCNTESGGEAGTRRILNILLHSFSFPF